MHRRVDEIANIGDVVGHHDGVETLVEQGRLRNERHGALYTVNGHAIFHVEDFCGAIIVHKRRTVIVLIVGTAVHNHVVVKSTVK